MAEQKEQSTRDKLRGATLGRKGQFKTEQVEVNGETFMVKQPSVAERKELFDAVRDDNGNYDLHEALIWSVIKLVYTPDGDERVFDEADYEAMMSEPTGGWVDQLAEHVGDVMYVEAGNEGNG